MNSKIVKLQNIIMQYDADANIGYYVDLMHTSSNKSKYPMAYNPEEKCHIIRKYDIVDFASYFICL